MKILFIHKQILFPHDTGGKIRALNVLRHLARWHEVTYLCNIRPGEDRHLPEMEALGMRLELIPGQPSRRLSVHYYGDVAANLFSRRPFTIDRNYDPALRARAEALVAEGGYDLVVCDTVQMAPHAVDLPVPTKVLFQHNVEARLLRRHAEKDPGWLRSRYMAIQWRKMRRYEGETGARFDSVIAISEPDRQSFEEDYGWRHVRAIETSVDLEYFRPTARSSVQGRVVFVGSMDWLPNQDGVTYFVEQVWPLVRRRSPGATFQVVGRNPTPAIQRLSGVDGVEVSGTVPDVRPYLNEAEVMVVPLLVGGGTRLKIFEAMAMGKAVVSTTVGAEGLSVTPGEHILMADDPRGLADAVASTLESPERRAALGDAARRLVNERFGTETVARQFDEICRAAARGHDRDEARSPREVPAPGRWSSL